MASNGKTELWQQNEKLRAENEELKLDIIQKDKDVKVCRDVEDPTEKKKPWWKTTKKILSFVLLGITFLVLMVALVIIYKASDAKSPQTALQKYNFDVGLGANPLLQECQGTDLKKTFPDLDYVLLGYDILKGYPLQVGHDPGFTLPLFRADYHEAGQTADCRFSVPKGMLLIPDVACVTSFSSKVVQTRYDFAESLSTSVRFSGGGWGVKFSASSGYKESSASISSGDSLFIISKASCDYYYSKLLQGNPPPFHPLFLKWVYRLNEASADDQTLYIEFFQQYGTHFLAEVTFGASFVYKHEMKTKQYESMSENGVNVAVSASYSGLFSVGGGFSLDQSQKKSASEFQKNVTTKTITRGAPPPANGDALTWASSVQENPIPVKYQLESIEDLFTEEYMDGLNVDYKTINEHIQTHKMNYCTYLKEKGQVDSCKEILPGIVLKDTRLAGHYSEISADLGTCQDKCAEDKNCIAITKCIQCTTESFYAGKCFLFSESQEKSADAVSGWETTILRPKISDTMELLRTAIKGIDRNEKPDSANNTTMCMEWCLQDEQCIAYSFCSGNCTKTQKCALFGNDGITGFKSEATTHSFIFGLRSRLSKSSSS